MIFYPRIAGVLTFTIIRMQVIWTLPKEQFIVVYIIVLA